MENDGVEEKVLEGRSREAGERMAWITVRRPGDVASSAVLPVSLESGRGTAEKTLERIEDARERAPSRRPARRWGRHPGAGVVVEPESSLELRLGLDPDLLLRRGYEGAVRIRDLDGGDLVARLRLGPRHPFPRSVRAAHDPEKELGFVASLLSLEDLSSSVWVWYRHRIRGEWRLRPVLSVPPEPADPLDLPPLLRRSEVVPPLVTSLALSPNDRWLWVACWGTGELRRYDATDPFDLRPAGSVRIGGVVRRSPHPRRRGKWLNGGPQGLAVSEDGRRVYLTNAFAPGWDDQLYPDGIRGWLTRVDAGTDDEALALAPDLFVELGELRPSRILLER